MIKTTDVPSVAGPVSLECTAEIGVPQRTRMSLQLPRREGMQFYPLKDGTQFVLCYPELNDEPRISGQIFFGGMDESAFITPIDKVPQQALLAGGEIGFFESLVPESMKKLSVHFAGTPRRQGDIWSFRIPMTWQEFEPYWRHENHKQKLKFRSRRKRLVTVLGTNHRLRGRYYSKGQIFIDGELLVKTRVGEGILTAADHKEQKCEGPHAFARTPHLVQIEPIVQQRFGWE